jgi:DNA ligase-4
MQCFQPQLAAFQMRSMEHMVSKMNPTESDPVFWIEEKLDGERMQLHMLEDDNVPGGKRFGFWSRKAKDYCYLYGTGFDDEKGALTRHLRNAFSEGVRNIILDGEMITWDPKEDAIVPFGTLKTAALAERENPYATGNRPLFRIFDCLFLNDKDLTRYTLRDRRKALSASVKDVHRRFEIHAYQEAHLATEIEPILRQVVAEASEGLVLKNPRSPYRLNERNDDWIKVKPEYMTEFGESLDCVVVGGYYGSGKRGGALSSFLCGLKVPQALLDHGVNEQKCWSFFKVGGGFAAADYAEVRHRTEGKWHDWNAKKPPTEWVELAGGDRQHEKPDVWIKPEDSIVISVKAASVGGSESFRTGVTLRFPRFKKLRFDKGWKQALSFDEFIQLKSQVEGEQEEKKLKLDNEKRQKSRRKRKRAMVIQGNESEIKTPYAGPATKVFDGLTFFIMTEAPKPIKKTKAELEELVKANGGKVVASEKEPDTIVIADRKLVKVASLVKKDERNLIKPSWLIDSIAQSERNIGRPSGALPYEPSHLFHTRTSDQGKFDDNVDEYGDSYARDVTSDELLELFKNMPSKLEDSFQPGAEKVLEQLLEHNQELDNLPGWMFHGLTAYIHESAPAEVRRLFQFAGGSIGSSLQGSEPMSHVIVPAALSSVSEIRKIAANRRQIPRIVSDEWVKQSWKERTKLDEDLFQN